MLFSKETGARRFYHYIGHISVLRYSKAFRLDLYVSDWGYPGHSAASTANKAFHTSEDKRLVRFVLTRIHIYLPFSPPPP